MGRTGGSGPQNPHRQQALLRRRRPAGSRGDRQYHFAGPHARFLFDGSYEEFKETLFKLGETPLPKWVREKVEPEDAERYQTIFASKEGAVAARRPACILKHLFKRMEIKGIEKAFITLHVGLGNFRTVDVEDLSKHKMDSEQFFVDEPTAETVNKTKREGHKIVSIGTTKHANARNGRFDRRHDQADGGLDQQVHLRPVRIFGGRRHGDQLPASLLDPTDDGFGIRRLRPDNECLQNSQRGGLPLRNLWRRDADSLRKITIFAEDRRRFGNLLRASPRDCSHLSLSLRKINFREVRYGSTTRQLFALHPARAFFAEQAKNHRFRPAGTPSTPHQEMKKKISTNGIEQDTIRLSGSGSVCPGYGRALLCRRLSQAMQERGNEIRTFMPRYGCINERRHQLHEVIRLSGMNLIIDDNDHQLIIKVASIPSARVQIYFIDNDDYFARKAILRDADENYFEDNDERAIFFARAYSKRSRNCVGRQRSSTATAGSRVSCRSI